VKELSEKDEDEQLTSFLIAEFKENWSYIRHNENIRLKHEQIFLVITGAIISVFSFLIKFPDTSLPQQSFRDAFNFIINNYGIPIIAGSGFIFLYGFSLNVFFAFQKRGYEHYRLVNSQIRGWFARKCSEGSQFNFEKGRSTSKTIRQLIFSTFLYWYLLIVFVNLSSFMVFSMTLLDLIVPSWSLNYILILSTFFTLCVLTIELLIFVKLNKEIE
jgi:hypothetical protein